MRCLMLVRSNLVRGSVLGPEFGKILTPQTTGTHVFYESLIVFTTDLLCGADTGGGSWREAARPVGRGGCAVGLCSANGAERRGRSTTANLIWVRPRGPASPSMTNDHRQTVENLNGDRCVRDSQRLSVSVPLNICTFSGISFRRLSESGRYFSAIRVLFGMRNFCL